MAAIRDPRRQQLARIHQAKKQLALDEDTYRALLTRVTGKASSADMTTAQRNAVIAELVRLGFKEAQARPARTWKGKPKNVDQVPMLGKVEALLADAKRPWAYAHNTARQMFKVARVEWLDSDQLHKLVAALQIDSQRQRRRSSSSMET
ncbi:GemA protein [Pseudoxanthomonas jiangsuensis]|uniref:gp16 family protein n=1 Tax=Pseudoxanthomonas jiangsuensis TaxID=619688 RepID=UPI00139134C6|nr:regulatory protein GemA [Pseudoxanthomonas jiangsuensis]KAF1692740.1 GemA protein [Pseudoxanthomonas jiangsuensis]